MLTNKKMLAYGNRQAKYKNNISWCDLYIFMLILYQKRCGLCKS